MSLIHTYKCNFVIIPHNLNIFLYRQIFIVKDVSQPFWIQFCDTTVTNVTLLSVLIMEPNSLIHLKMVSYVWCNQIQHLCNMNSSSQLLQLRIFRNLSHMQILFPPFRQKCSNLFTCNRVHLLYLSRHIIHQSSCSGLAVVWGLMYCSLLAFNNLENN